MTITPDTPDDWTDTVEPERAEAFVERLPANLGYNLRHYGNVLHRIGEECLCLPSRIPHVGLAAPESARPATLTPERPVKAPGQGGDLVLPRRTPVEVGWPNSGNRALRYLDEDGYQEIDRAVGDGYPIPWDDARIVRVLTEDKPARQIKPEDVRVGMVVERRNSETYVGGRVKSASGMYILTDAGTVAWSFNYERVFQGWSLWLVEDAPAPVDPDAADRQCAWADYRKDYGVGESEMAAAHKAFMAGWKAAREGDQSGPLR